LLPKERFRSTLFLIEMMMLRSFLSFVFFLFIPVQALLATSSSNVVGALGDYSAEAAGLFNNMRTPAALIGGALVPIGILNAPTIQEHDSKRMKLLKKINIVIGVASLLSEILAVVYSSIAINKIAEVAQPQTTGVAQLIAEKHELAWLGTNIHFLLGMLGFSLIVGSKSFFAIGASMGRVTISWSIATFLQALAIVNRGIALGSGNEVKSRFASNFGILIVKYISYAYKASRGGVCGFAAFSVTIYAVWETIKTLIVSLNDNDDIKNVPAP